MDFRWEFIIVFIGINGEENGKVGFNSDLLLKIK